MSTKPHESKADRFLMIFLFSREFSALCGNLLIMQDLPFQPGRYTKGFITSPNLLKEL
jgi:hypothetical protein